MNRNYLQSKHDSTQKYLNDKLFLYFVCLSLFILVEDNIVVPSVSPSLNT